MNFSKAVLCLLATASSASAFAPASELFYVVIDYWSLSLSFVSTFT